MRIFYVTQAIGDWGGSEIYSRDIVRELMKRGHDVFVFTFSSWNYPDMKMHRVPVFGHHAFYKFEMPFFSGDAIKLAKGFKPDIVHSHGGPLVGIMGHLIKKKLGIPHVGLNEAIISINRNVHGKVVFQIEKFFIPKLNYDRIIVWTNNMRNKFLIPWGIDQRKIEVIPAALNLDSYDPSIDGSEIRKKYGEHLITCVKTLYFLNGKGLEYVVRAMKIVSKKHPEYRLLIFGEGTHRSILEELVKKLGIEKYVELPGGVPPEVYKKVCAVTDVAPHSFVYEFSTSVSLLEYMAMGRPCVVTDIGSVREFVGDSTLIVKPEDPEDMAKGIIKLIENPKLREILGKKARKRVEERYSIKASVDAIEKIYEGLTRKNLK